jgi:hypothetical protein
LREWLAVMSGCNALRASCERRRERFNGASRKMASRISDSSIAHGRKPPLGTSAIQLWRSEKSRTSWDFQNLRRSIARFDGGSARLPNVFVSKRERDRDRDLDVEFLQLSFRDLFFLFASN